MVTMTDVKSTVIGMRTRGRREVLLFMQRYSLQIRRTPRDEQAQTHALDTPPTIAECNELEIPPESSKTQRLLVRLLEFVLTRPPSYEHLTCLKRVVIVQHVVTSFSLSTPHRYLLLPLRALGGTRPPYAVCPIVRMGRNVLDQVSTPHQQTVRHVLF